MIFLRTAFGLRLLRCLTTLNRENLNIFELKFISTVTVTILQYSKVEAILNNGPILRKNSRKEVFYVIFRHSELCKFGI